MVVLLSPLRSVSTSGEFRFSTQRHAMKLGLLGHLGPLAQATRQELLSRGHQITDSGAECIIFFPGSLPGPANDLESVVQKGGFRRLVLRSSAYAYGSNAKNPGFMTEDRVSLLPRDAPEQSWLAAERIAFTFPNSAALRFSNVLAAQEGDEAVKQLTSRVSTPPAGRNPNVQFITVKDGARALAAAAESDATGLFNVTGDGALPFKEAQRASGALRMPLPSFVSHLAGKRQIDQLEYNWTVSGERAARDLGFTPKTSSLAALREFLGGLSHGRPQRLRESYDPWGLDVDYIRAWNGWFTFLGKVYWRIELEGMENIPDRGRALFVSNHRGFMPLDAVMHLFLILKHRRRITRFLIIHSLLKLPYLCNFLTKLGGVIASQENAARLFADENVVGIFPEGIRGSFTPYKSTYRLRDFAKSAFVRIAIENQAPIIPAAVIGHAEIFPIIGRINWSYLTREYGWPYLPIAPLFPLAPVPIPSKWHIRVLEPVSLRDSALRTRRIRTWSGSSADIYSN